MLRMKHWTTEMIAIDNIYGQVFGCIGMAELLHGSSSAQWNWVRFPRIFDKMPALLRMKFK